MGLIDAIQGRHVYLDANVFIYLFEAPETYGATLHVLARSLDQGLINAATSELTLAEVLVKPIREAPSYIPIYQQYLRTRSHFEVHPVSRAVLVEAARLRAGSPLKLPDAIHAATAMQTNCEVFLTNDGRIKSITGLDVLQLADFAA